jgi:sec-independent protein translocase protein TatB
MFDVGWTELLLIAVVALFVIGPRDLPKALKTVGAWTARARSLAREFQSGVDEMIRESELDELRKSAEKAMSVDLEKEIKDTVDPTGSLEKSLDFSDIAAADAAGSYQPPAPEAEAAPPVPESGPGPAAEPAPEPATEPVLPPAKSATGS